MKTEAEKIAEFCPIGCYCCDKADFNGKSIICFCTLKKEEVPPMSACNNFKSTEWRK